MIKNVLFGSLIVLITTSCSPYKYQVFTTSAEEVKMNDDDVLLYENTDLAVSYDLWSEGGQVLFNVYNNTDKIIYLSVPESGMIVNSDTVSYFRKKDHIHAREYTVRTLFLPQENKFSDLILKIEPSEQKTLEAFHINWDWFKIKKPNRHIQYSKDTSPLQFSQFLTYSFDADLKEKTKLHNQFWTSKITKVTKRQFREYVNPREDNSDKFYVYKYPNPKTLYWLEMTAIALESLSY